MKKKEEGRKRRRKLGRKKVSLDVSIVIYKRHFKFVCVLFLPFISNDKEFHYVVHCV